MIKGMPERAQEARKRFLQHRYFQVNWASIPVLNGSFFVMSINQHTNTEIVIPSTMPDID